LGKLKKKGELFKTNNTKLVHETPSGDWSKEHHILDIPDGKYVLGKQCEYNPFNREVSLIID
jgi:hypothetical protein